MPVLHVHDWDKQFVGLQYPEVPGMEKPRCAALELDWLRCADGLGRKRAQKECKAEMEDFWECAQGTKKMTRYHTILKERKKLMAEGKYTPPPEHQ